ncbi:hypothetical protein evm_010218 [Chilo suppressalis]|nr:hypothetical protein evm_010218 [Chilo suppressalis]
MQVQRPEDFMDDEDRDEFGIAPRHLQTRSYFTGQKRKHQRYHEGPIPGEPVLEQLLKAVHETAAVRMLRAMGWRPGQGTGDRLTKEEKRKRHTQHKVYGCYMPPEMRQNEENAPESSSSDSEYEYDTLFAPDDYEPYILHRKSDRFGLGYSGLSRHSVLGSLSGHYGETSTKSHLVMREKGKKVSIRGQAFGVGAFEADDEDIYATEDMSHYDFALGGADDKPKKTANKDKGVNVLVGFVKASKPLPQVPSYPPPALPRDYRPAEAGTKRSRFEPTAAPQRDQGLGRHELTAEARGALLGEQPVPKLPDPIDTPQVTPTPPEDAIAKITGRNVNFVSTNENKELDFIPIKETGDNVLKTFRPFLSVPEKQARYESYLRDKEAFMREGDSNIDAVSEWERNRELAEFEQAAKLYKPLTGFIGDRFTHASEPDEGAVNPLCAVAKSTNSYGLATPEQIEAAKRGVYGLMTRKETKWRPESLVCKRFNIPDPGGVRMETKTEDKPKVSYSIFSYMESSVHDKDSFAKEQHKFSGSRSMNLPKPIQTTPQQSGNSSQVTQNRSDNLAPSTSTENEGFSKRMTVADLFMKESEKDMKSKENVNETIEKFDKMDLYKAIFLSDSEDENEEPKTGTTDDKTTEADDFMDKPKNVERNTSPPRGIFANIDFDELNSWRRNIGPNMSINNAKTDDSKQDGRVNDKEKIEAAAKNAEADVYGPKIPENLQKRLEGETDPDKEFKPVFRRKTDNGKDVVEVDSSSSSDSWVDVKEVKAKKHKKKKKKHKAKHKKGKHKKKDR